jgi:hypothetical protein
MQLQKQCVLQARRCSLAGLLGQRKDLAATGLIAQRFSSAQKAVSGIKYLINRQNRQVKDVVSAGQAFREAGYGYSFAWGDTKGLRLVPCKAEPQVRAETDKAEARFWDAVDKYVAVYPELVREAELKTTGLGLLFDAEEYPAKRKIRGMFQCATEYMPVPESKHFVAELAEDVANDAREQLTKTIALRANEAVNDIVARVETGVGDYLDKLGRYKVTDDRVEQTFRDSINSNVTALAELVRKLNFSDDPGLDNLAEQISRLARYSAERLREDGVTRNSMINEGKSLIAKLDGFRKIDNEVDNIIAGVADYV